VGSVENLLNAISRNFWFLEIAPLCSESDASRCRAHRAAVFFAIAGLSCSNFNVCKSGPWFRIRLNSKTLIVDLFVTDRLLFFVGRRLVVVLNLHSHDA